MAFVIPGHTPDRRNVRGALKRLRRAGIRERTAYLGEVSFVASPDRSPLKDGYVLYYDSCPGSERPARPKAHL